MEAIVVGNVTLDILCYHVEEVPRYDSLPFERALIAPGGCGSNTAIGLSQLGVKTALVARVAGGETFSLIEPYWRRADLDIRYVIVENDEPAVSVGLIDRLGQPRFVHTPGANRKLTVGGIDLEHIAGQGARFLHIAGFLALPGLMDAGFPLLLAKARSMGLKTSLDVINSPLLDTPESVGTCLPHLDYFFCNLREGQRMTGFKEAEVVGAEICRRGAGAAVVKLGEKGCWLESALWQGLISTEVREPVDTTGAGDAFAAGFIGAILRGADDQQACVAGHRAAGCIVSRRGAATVWFSPGA
jgi:sugar/nucleoside kinase (ribokinase family)